MFVCYEKNIHTHTHKTLFTGMNAAVRATVRVGLYTGARVYFVHEVNTALDFTTLLQLLFRFSLQCQKIHTKLNI